MKLCIANLFWLFVLAVLAGEAGGLKLAPDGCDVNGSCCAGHGACTNSGKDGTATTKKGSCTGTKACADAAIASTGTFTVGENGCKQDYACYQTAKQGEAEIAHDSCVGRQACQYAALEQNGKLSIETDVCVGHAACYEAARSGGSLTAEQGSCHGVWACGRAGRSGKAAVKRGACDGRSACQTAAYDAAGTFEAELNSCQGDYACADAGKAGSAKISAGSCIFKAANDKSACQRAGMKGTFTVAESSCIGQSACLDSAKDGGESVMEKDTCIGHESCRASGNAAGGSFKVEEGSCKGPWACYAAGDGKGGSVVISRNSCVSDDPQDGNSRNACSNSGKLGNFTVAESSCLGGWACTSVSERGGNAVIEENACIGRSACQDSAKFGGKSSMEKDTCIGREACRASGAAEGGSFKVEEGGCKGPWACYATGNGKGGSATISSDSCVSDDPQDGNSRNACSNSGKQGNFTVAESSCLGGSACTSVSEKGGNAVIQKNACIGVSSCKLVSGEAGSSLIQEGSCKGPSACYEIGRKGSATISSGSCIAEASGDKNVCASAGRDGNFNVDESSCLGAFACNGSGRGANATSVIQKRSCIGTAACQYSAYDTGGNALIKDDSCKGPYACYEAGRYGSATISPGACIASDEDDDKVRNACAHAGRKGKFTVAESSCSGTYACTNSAGNGGESVIQKEACIGEGACQNSAYDPNGRFLPQESSCRGPYACFETGRNGFATVGTGSCISSDKNDANVKHACAYAGRNGNFTVAQSSCLGAFACSGSAGNGESVIPDDACIGRSACQSSAHDANGKFLPENGSCKGPWACSDAGRDGSATIGSGSCIATDSNDPNVKSACSHVGRKGNFTVTEAGCLGKYACSGSAYYGEAVIEKEACIGTSACQNSAFDASGSLVAGEGSCTGNRACADAGRKGSTTTKAKACDGDASCAYAAGNGGQAFMNENSCSGKSACQACGYDKTGSFSAQEYSCKGPWACSDVGRAGSAKVGKGSCIAEDENDANVKYACSWAARDVGGNFTVGDNSCTDSSACTNSGRRGSSVIGSNSCDSVKSCENSAYKGNFTVADGSCNGYLSCSNIAFDTGSSVKIGNDSCTSDGEERSCERVANRGGQVEIGDRSCKGKWTCRDAAFNLGTVKIGDDSCLGFQACYQIANAGGDVAIGDGSCQSEKSCRAIGRTAIEHESITKERGRLEIGNGSCNCEGCCGCLKAGDKVPDGMCNSFGSEAEHCCTAEGDRNPFGPLKVSNLCVEEENKCLKATVSGDPHITTFSGTRFDCMGQGEFILAKSQNQSDPLEIRGLFVDPDFKGEDDPWENNRSAQTVTRGVSFVVDEDIPRITITTDTEKGQSCNLYFHVDGVGNVTLNSMLNDASLFKRQDVSISGASNWMSFRFGDYDADFVVRVHHTSHWGCMMSMSACLKPKYHGDVLGLFGTNNMYKDDDWTTPTGTRLIIPSDSRSVEYRGLSTSYCLDNWCYEGPGGPSDGSFFSDYLSNYYSRCNKSPYTRLYNETAVDEMLKKIRSNCDDAGIFNIHGDVLYDAALTNHRTNPTDTKCPVQDIFDFEIDNAIAAFNCELAPTPAPSAQPSYVSDSSPTVINGDPHFKTWMGEHFEYHGQCDLVMMKDPSFADGLGLQIQIRTKLVRYWSYIRSVAILIGDDILEIEGSADFVGGDELLYWYNLEEKGEMKTLGGFPVSSHRRSKIKQRFVIDLSSKYPGQSIEIHTFKEFVKVEYVNGSEESVGKSVGMMGDFTTGETRGRDGSVFDDFTELGIEWQVRPEDQMLFHDISHPQFPKTCVLPEDPQGQRRRRLEESSIKEADAEKACASLKDPLDRKDCIYDVLATQDLEMVGAF